MITLQHPIIQDRFTESISRMFDVPISDVSVTKIPNEIDFPDEWQIGAIVGKSGAGKSTILGQFGEIFKFTWDDIKSVISNFPSKTPEEVSAAFCAAGFSTIPAWLRPYKFLSEGEKFRADLAASLLSDREIILVDEFSSKIDRNVAKSASFALQKFIRRTNRKIIVASCHTDILEYLSPCWSYDPTEALTHVYARGSLQRPEICLKIFRSKYEAWELFKGTHYLTGELNKAARCYMATWNDAPVAFTAILAMPHPYRKNCWRESRTVVLPDFQGLGLGVKLSDYMGALIKAGDGRYYSKTIAPSMIAHRLKCGKWKETSHSREARDESGESMQSRGWIANTRYCFAFEYIGEAATKEEAQLFWDISGVTKFKTRGIKGDPRNKK